MITTVVEKKAKKTVLVINEWDKPIESESLQQAMSRLQRKSNVVAKEIEMDPDKKGRIRKQTMRCHGFRKFFDTVCIESNMKHIAKEMIMGHKKEQGLDRSYYRPTSDKLLEEYLKVVDDLTINDENRLKRENDELKEKKQETDYIIKGKLREMEEQNKLLTTKVQEYQEAAKKLALLI